MDLHNVTRSHFWCRQEKLYFLVAEVNKVIHSIKWSSLGERYIIVCFLPFFKDIYPLIHVYLSLSWNHGSAKLLAKHAGCLPLAKCRLSTICKEACCLIYAKEYLPLASHCRSVSLADNRKLSLWWPFWAWLPQLLRWNKIDIRCRCILSVFCFWLKGETGKDQIRSRECFEIHTGGDISCASITLKNVQKSKIAQ